MKSIINLDGVVLRSVDIHRTGYFYQALLNTEFEKERHGNGPMHYAGRPEGFPLLEIYPSKKEVTPPSPELTFRVLRQSIIHERIREYLNKDLQQTGEKQWECYDPDQRKLIFLQEERAEDFIEFRGVGLHARHPDATKAFYGLLLGDNVLCSKNAHSYSFSLGRYEIEVHPSNKDVVPASPTLLFEVSKLDYFAEKFGGRVQEKKEFPDYREITLYDTDGRRIFLHQKTAAPKSWWQKILSQ